MAKASIFEYLWLNKIGLSANQIETEIKMNTNVHSLKTTILNTLNKKENAAYTENHAEEILNIIKKVFKTDEKEIQNIEVLKAGMTNNSFVFTVNHKRYIMRVPGAGSEHIINRQEEKSVYDVILPYQFCDNVIFFDEKKGYKITSFIENSHNLDPFNKTELIKAFDVLRSFHDKKLKVKHFFDVFKMIDYYESLMKHQSVYEDYEITKANVRKLKSVIDNYDITPILCHIDAVHDNFIISENKIHLIDFEYSAMQDKDLDLAMFVVYAMYNRQEVDAMINLYYHNNCDLKIKYKIYAYIAMAGLLWSNWCEYKIQLGSNFGAYAKMQYQFAKEYYSILLTETANISEFDCLRTPFIK